MSETQWPANGVETFTGRVVDVGKPNPQDIDLGDIAHALSNIARYGGHAKFHYSVAQHAVFCSQRLERRRRPVIEQLAALHHDDAEAYLGDIPRPMKPLLGGTYKKMTAVMDVAIVEALNLPFKHDAFDWPVVKEADNWALLVEARHLLPSQGRGWTISAKAEWDLEEQGRIVTPDYWRDRMLPEDVEVMYLDRHNMLIDRLENS